MIKQLKKNLDKSPLKILIIANQKTDKTLWDQLLQVAQEYFNITWDYLNFLNQDNWQDFEVPDVLFIDFQEDYNSIFNWEFYDKCHTKNHIFLQIMILETFNKNDYKLFKHGADEIIYKNDGFEFLKWKIISMLRRSWDSHSKKTTIMCKGMILDKNKNRFYFNETQIHLTKKELQLMDLLMTNVNAGFITKRKIFVSLWDDQGEDNSRVVDQIIFKIKKKLGKEVFEITKKGIKII